MRGNSPNPLVYAFPAIALVAVLAYYLYGAVDRLGLNSERAEARVIGKQLAAGSTTYNTNVVAGRAWTQSSKNPDAYVIGLEVNGEAAGGAVSPELYETLQPGDVVRVEFQRTRFSKQIVVTGVHR
jgi:hypothetical protein